MKEIKRIEDQLQRAFEGDAWSGPSVREVLGDVTAEQAARRPIEGAHTIWELVLHIAFWKNVARRRLAGEAVRDIRPDENWPAVSDTSAAAWNQAREALERAHRHLHDALSGISESRLDDKLPGEAGVEYTVYATLHGVLQHDLYHAGQVAILKKGRP